MTGNTYLSIDMKKTGLLLKEKLEGSGYSVKEIQKYLQLSCPQPIYRWYKGKMLPSIDHLLMLSHLLGVHMEELLVTEVKVPKVEVEHQEISGNVWEHLLEYFRKFQGRMA